MATDARTIAARLGLDELAVRRLQARGHLLRLDADDREIRERLYRANVRPLPRHRPLRDLPVPDPGEPPTAA